MLQITLQSNNQLVLPDVIVRQANLHQDDKFYIHYEHNEIRLIKIESSDTQKTNIMDFLGCAKGVYGNSDQEIDGYLHNERLSWDNSL